MNIIDPQYWRASLLACSRPAEGLAGQFEDDILKCPLQSTTTTTILGMSEFNKTTDCDGEDGPYRLVDLPVGDGSEEDEESTGVVEPRKSAERPVARDEVAELRKKAEKMRGAAEYLLINVFLDHYDDFKPEEKEKIAALITHGALQASFIDVMANNERAYLITNSYKKTLSGFLDLAIRVGSTLAELR